MDNELKGELNKAFDEDRLAELPDDLLRRVAADAEAARYLNLIRGIDKSLAEPQAGEVPAGFSHSVLDHLPSRRLAAPRALRWRDLFLPSYIAAVLVLSFIFRDALGITTLLQVLGQALSNTGDIGREVVFSVASAFAILLSTWLIVSAFFGIRSRRKKV